MVMVPESWDACLWRCIIHFRFYNSNDLIIPIPVGLISTTFFGGEGLGCPPSKIGPNWARKVLETVFESSQKIIGGIIYTQNVRNAFYLAKNAVKNQQFC